MSLKQVNGVYFCQETQKRGIGGCQQIHGSVGIKNRTNESGPLTTFDHVLMIDHNENYKEELLSKIYLGKTCTFVCPTNYDKNVKVLYSMIMIRIYGLLIKE